MWNFQLYFQLIQKVVSSFHDFLIVSAGFLVLMCCFVLIKKIIKL